MAVLTNPTERPTSARIEQALMARLGLTLDATPEEIEEAHDRLLAFLETAPHELRLWTRLQVAAADEAYALLADDGAPAYLPAEDELPVREPASPSPAHASTPPAARASTLGAAGAGRELRATRVAPAESADDDLPEELEETEGAGMPVRRAKARTARAVSPAVAARERTGSRRVRGGAIRRVLVAVAAVAVVAVVGFTVYNSGATTVPGVTGTPAPEASSTAVDPAKVNALMQKITADPKDTASLLELGNLYFDSGDYTTARTFMQKVVDIDPNNVDALVGLGAAQFNTGDAAAAKTSWTKATELSPKDQEAWFDLGFLYLNQNPPDMDQVRLNWNKVLEIDPTTKIAQTVQTHLAAIAPSASPGASQTASPSAAAAAPSASAAASAAPAGASPAASGN